MADLATLQSQLADLKSQGKGLSNSKSYAKIYGQIKGMGGSASGGDVVQNAIKLQQNAIKPAIESYNAEIPEISTKYGNLRTQLGEEKTNLQSRYDNLLASIKGNQSISENRQTLATGNELAKRGITSDSGLYQQELTNAVNPITQQYSTQYTDTGLQGEQDIRDIVNQITNSTTNETADTRAIRNAIAQMQSGAAQTGISQGLNQQYQNQVLANQQATSDREAKANKKTQDLQDLIYQTITLPGSNADIAYKNALTSKANSSKTKTLADIFGGSGGSSI